MDFIDMRAIDWVKIEVYTALYRYRLSSDGDWRGVIGVLRAAVRSLARVEDAVVDGIHHGGWFVLLIAVVIGLLAFGEDLKLPHSHPVRAEPLHTTTQPIPLPHIPRILAPEHIKTEQARAHRTDKETEHKHDHRTEQKRWYREERLAAHNTTSTPAKRRTILVSQNNLLNLLRSRPDMITLERARPEYSIWPKSYRRTFLEMLKEEVVVKKEAAEEG